jgi:hypothetical protein
MVDWDGERQAGQDRATRSLAGLALVLCFVVIGVFLAQRLAETARLEDCLMTGRTNCAPIEMAAR